MPLLEVVEDFADTEQTHCHDDEVDAVGELQAVEREAGGTAEGVAAHGGQQQAHRACDHRLELVAAADGRHEQHAEQRERGVLRRAEIQRDFGDHRGEQGQADDRDGGTYEGADRSDAQSRSGPALFGQGEAVEHRDDRRRLTGQSQQDRGDGAAILGAVIDAREHDDRRHRVDRVGDGQQDRDGGRRAQPGQHADDHADEDAGEAVQQVRRLHDDDETVEECVEVHGPVLFRARSSGATGFAARRGRGGRTPRP
jgi:hypothetical protein